ncbi:MAG TPA: hypothetical protein VG963_20835, partial [Polyangiaceae bacterium]|nr:hypothetical protein [Polyangiaceae bacterium]
PSALRDDSQQTPKPFSYSRVQLLFWTIVILSCWVGEWGESGQFWQLNETCLALLGIGGATTLAGRMIDARDAADTRVDRQKNLGTSTGFFQDILSDSQGVSVHRFQGLAFNLAYALSFALQTFQAGAKKFPDFEGSTLALLGISAGTYVALKATENRPTTATGDATANPGVSGVAAVAGALPPEGAPASDPAASAVIPVQGAQAAAVK